LIQSLILLLAICLNLDVFNFIKSDPDTGDYDPRGKDGGIADEFSKGGGPLVAIMNEIVDRFADETFRIKYDIKFQIYFLFIFYNYN